MALALCMLTAQAQSSCPARSLNWTATTTGLTCSGKLPVTLASNVATAANTLSGKMGYVNVRCTDGVWSPPSNYQCLGTATTAPKAAATSVVVIPVFTAPTVDAAEVAAARLLEQATFGPTKVDIARVRQLGATNWVNAQLLMPPTAIAPGGDSVETVRDAWFTTMASAPDQLRQRMVFALSQILVVSSNKNATGQELTPWLQTLSRHAFGNFSDLLRDMTLNPAMGKYLALGHSKAPGPNEDFAREVMQLFTIGLVELNLDGSPKLDAYGKTIPTYTQARISEVARALSGWGFATSYEDMSSPLVPRESYHDHGSKTLLNGVVLPIGQTAQQDLEGVINNLAKHPNTAPFISLRLIRNLVTSNPSRAYVQRVATVFRQTNGNLASTLRAILLDPEARNTPAAGAGHLRDPVLHTLSLVRALDGKVVSPRNALWDYYLMGQRVTQAPSVFSFYSPLAPVPGSTDLAGPEFQLYGGSLAVRRANFVLAMLDGSLKGSINIDLAPFLAVAGEPQTLMALVERTLLQGRMTPAARQAIGEAVVRVASDDKQRVLTALYLTAITGDYVVQK